MDEHFAPDFKWRQRINWDQNFTYTDRTYFTVSFGFEVTTFIPFQQFQQMDNGPDDVNNVGEFIRHLADSFSLLLD